jgi:hypothetical protein
MLNVYSLILLLLNIFLVHTVFKRQNLTYGDKVASLVSILAVHFVKGVFSCALDVILPPVVMIMQQCKC